MKKATLLTLVFVFALMRRMNNCFLSTWYAERHAQMTLQHDGFLSMFAFTILRFHGDESETR